MFDEDGAFVELPPPPQADLEGLLLRVATRVVRLLGRQLPGDIDDEDALAPLQAESLQRRLPFADPAPSPQRFAAYLEGFSLHAGVRIAAPDEAGRERLCGYGARGPIALSRLSRDDDGRYRYQMKRALRDGTRDLVLDGVELLRRLAALVPPKRQNLIRYHGVFAPNAKLRPLVVPRRAPVLRLPKHRPAGGPWRTDWAELLRRVFGVDVLRCARCGSRMRLIAFVNNTGAARKILDHLRLPSVPQQPARARAPPQQDWDRDAA